MIRGLHLREFAKVREFLSNAPCGKPTSLNCFPLWKPLAELRWHLVS